MIQVLEGSIDERVEEGEWQGKADTEKKLYGGRGVRGRRGESIVSPAIGSREAWVVLEDDTM